MRLKERRIVASLREHDYKLTPQRRKVIRAIASSHNHLTPAAICERVHRDDPNIGLVTVYRTINLLAKLGLICELHAGSSCRSYTLGIPEHHHHLICSNCGTVLEFTDYDLSELERQLSLETKFKIKDHLLEFIGLCQACQKKAT